MTDLDTRSLERGWPPFTDWMRSHGLDPDTTSQLHIDDSTGPPYEVTVREIARDSEGKMILAALYEGRWIERGTEEAMALPEATQISLSRRMEVRYDERVVKVSDLPPVHPHRKLSQETGVKTDDIPGWLRYCHYLAAKKRP